MTQKYLHLEMRGNVAVVRLARPAKRNALGDALILALRNQFENLPAEAKAADQDLSETSARTSIAVVPLTIPLLTGPATMSTVVIYADQAKTFFQHAALVG